MIQDHPWDDVRLEAELAMLAVEMPRLQAQAGNVFVLASAWAKRHDAILAATPAESLEAVKVRLTRIGIRWGMMDGVRMTAQFPALQSPGPEKG